MIFADSLESFLETVYLGERITTKRSGNSIHVNPGEKNDYLVGKTVILTKEYSPEIVENLKLNMNTVLGRVWMPEVIYVPYQTRINFKIQWNGIEVRVPLNINDIFKWLLSEDLVMTRLVDNTVEYIGFPKILGIEESLLYDRKGEITLLGWALHQVGLNIDKKAKWKDLDLIKTKKMDIGSPSTSYI